MARNGCRIPKARKTTHTRPRRLRDCRTRDASPAHARRAITGKRPARGNDKKQSLIRDVLIAVTAHQHSVTVISDNKDFPLIQQVYGFDWRKAADFFATYCSLSARCV